MTQAIGSQAYLALQKETTFATDPGTLTLINLPFVSESLSKSVDQETSDTIRGDRNAVLERAIAILDCCRKADIQNVAFATLAEESG